MLTAGEAVDEVASNLVDNRVETDRAIFAGRSATQIEAVVPRDFEQPQGFYRLADQHDVGYPSVLEQPLSLLQLLNLGWLANFGKRFLQDPTLHQHSMRRRRISAHEKNTRNLATAVELDCTVEPGDLSAFSPVEHQHGRISPVCFITPGLNDDQTADAGQDQGHEQRACEKALNRTQQGANRDVRNHRPIICPASPANNRDDAILGSMWRLTVFLLAMLGFTMTACSGLAGAPRDDSPVAAQARVDVDIFSGRPNPAYLLSEADTKEVAQMLGSLEETPADHFSDPLGYRGFQLQLPGSQADEGIQVRVFGGLVRYDTRATTQYFLDPERKVERWLVASAEPHLPPGVYEAIPSELRQ